MGSGDIPRRFQALVPAGVLLLHPFAASAAPVIHAVDVVRDEVRDTRVEMTVSGRRGPAAVAERFTTHGGAANESANFAVDASAMAGKFRAKFRANGVEDLGFRSRGSQTVSVDYDIWQTHGRLIGQRYEFATTLTHATTLDSKRNDAVHERRDHYRTNNAVVVRGQIADLRLSLRQGWSGGYATEGDHRRTDARQNLDLAVELPLADVFGRAGFPVAIPFSPTFLLRASHYDQAMDDTVNDLFRESGRRSAVGLSLGRERWSLTYLTHRRSRTQERIRGKQASLDAVGHDVKVALRLADRFNIDLDLAWERIDDGGKLRTQSAQRLDLGWRLFENASFALGVFSRERNERDVRTKNSRRGIETRLELPIVAFSRWRPLSSLGGRFVVKQDVAMNVDDRRGAGGDAARAGAWSILCSLEIAHD